MPPTTKTEEKKLEPQDQKNPASSGDSTQQTKDQKDPPIDDKNIETPEPIDPNYVRNLEERIAAQQIQFRTMERLVESSRETKETTPAPTPRNIEEERKSFYSDPTGVLDARLDARDQKILSQMEKMLAPLKEVAVSFKSTSVYDKMKNDLKLDPIWGKGLKDPDVERYVDSIMRSGDVEVTEDNMKSAISQAFGMKSMGALGNGNRRTATPPDNNTHERIDPPNIPTTRTRSQMPEQTKELTEDDRIAMKIATLNPNNPEHVKEYWNLIGDDKMTLSVHKPKENK